VLNIVVDLQFSLCISVWCETPGFGRRYHPWFLG